MLWHLYKYWRITLELYFFLLQDISAKVIALSQVRARALCVLSGFGSVSAVTLGQPSSSGGTVQYEVWTLSYYYCVNLIWIHLQVHMKLLFMAYGIVLIRVNMIDCLINAVVARMP
jgi:hypothetical protein